MQSMKRLSILPVAVIWTLVGMGAVFAQQPFIPPGGSQFNPPLPPPPQVPKIEVPVVPKMDAPPSQPRVKGLDRGSFSDRVTKCSDDAAASGLTPGERATYAGACANR
jgi:hypothetical protein